MEWLLPNWPKLIVRCPALHGKAVDPALISMKDIQKAFKRNLKASSARRARSSRHVPEPSRPVRARFRGWKLKANC